MSGATRRYMKTVKISYKNIDELSLEAEEAEEAKEEAPKEVSILDRLKNMAFSEPENEKSKKKKKKCKYKCCEYMIIFDDLSSELKSKSLLNLLKKNRHYKSKLIISHNGYMIYYQNQENN